MTNKKEAKAAVLALANRFVFNKEALDDMLPEQRRVLEEQFRVFTEITGRSIET